MKQSVLVLGNSDSGLYDFRKEVLTALMQEGYEVHVSVPDTGYLEKIKKLGCICHETVMERRGMNPLKDGKLLLFYRKLLKTIHPAAVLTYTIKPNIYGGVACRLAKVPYLVNITGLGTAFQGNGMLRKMVTFMYKVALKKAKIVFFENVENRETIVDAGIISEKKTHVLAGAGVDLEHFYYAQYPMDTEETRFLFIGRVMQEKGIDELFEAMKKLHQEGYKCSLDVLGGFEENYSDKIKQYEKEGWLHYWGYQNDIRPFVEKAHCFVLPSWHEGMANTNLESAASGRPLLTTNIHGCKEAVIDEVSGFLVKKNSADDLYEKMLRFINLPVEQKRQMGLAGRKLMEEKFDKRDVVKKTIEEIFSSS